MNTSQLAQLASTLTRAQFARLIEHTHLRANASQREIAQLCDEAVRYGFITVSVLPVWVSFCAKRLSGSGVGIGACVGFPLGGNTAAVKVAEAREAVASGATEIDMVINIGAIKSGYPDFVRREIAAVVQASGHAPVKAIIETGFLSTEEKISVCEMSMRAGAVFVKTSTGYGPCGATIEDVELMRRTVGERLGVKAAGGIRSYADALQMIEAGASRIGTSSGVAIIEEMAR